MTGASLAFFARHEARLALREWLWWLRAARRNLAVAIVLGALVFAGLHLIAGIVVRPVARLPAQPDAAGYLLLAAAGAMAFLLLLSQAMESVTRVLYARGDVDLFLSSPAPAAPVFALRLATIAAVGMLMSIVILGPFVNMLVFAGSARWLSAYGVLAAMAMLATAIAIGSTLLLFRMIGARRTRVAAQVVAAIIGAAMVIALQVGAILSHQGMGRFDALRDPSVLAFAPGVESPVWLPVRAATGDLFALALVVAVAAVALTATIVIAARGFAERVVEAAGATQGARVARASIVRFRGGVRGVLRAKELALLARDPWLLSQSLMQILYLLPPALLLWVSFGDGGDPSPIIVPAIVMAAGQLAGGLAWLAISGEDAPDLIGTSPVPAGLALATKIEAVVIALALPLAPLVIALGLFSPVAALVALVFALVAAGGSTLIQLFFRSQARRSMFRRRQTASRASTICEALSSNCWAGAAGLAVYGTWLALAPAVIALLVLGVARVLAPSRSGQSRI